MSGVMPLMHDVVEEAVADESRVVVEDIMPKS